MFSIYIWLDGDDFDAEGFQAGLGKGVVGSVNTRKRMRNGVVEQFGKYWKSEVRKPILDKPEDELVKLLLHYRDEIQRAKTCSATRIVAEIVAEFSSLDDARGFYFSVDSISLLAELGVSIDIDIVRNMRE